MSKEKLTRRQFVAAAAALPGLAALSQMGTAASLLAPAAAAAPATGAAVTGAKGFSFVLLGDIHFDKLEHHDMEWLAKEHEGDIRQIVGGRG